MRYRYTVLTAMLVVVLLGRVAFAQTTSAELSVHAKVPPDCVLQSPLALDFGTYNPSVQDGSPLDAVGNVLTVACTRGAPAVTIALDNGQDYFDSHRNLHGGSGSDTVGYEIYIDASHATVWNMVQTVGYLPVTSKPTSIMAYGRVIAGQKPHPGRYSDTLLAMVNF